MKLDVLICTCNSRIGQVPHVLLPPRPDVSYIVSMQYTDKSYIEQVPDVLLTRDDVRVIYLEGLGLSRNRNHAIAAATGDVALIADDDCRYRNEYFDRIISTFVARPDVDIAQFRMNAEGHNPVKPYPAKASPYAEWVKGQYVSSVELAFRPNRVRERVCFDEHFGLGTQTLVCGEEEVWVYDAVQAGLSVWFFPYDVIDMAYRSTGLLAYTHKGVMRAKGAVNRHLFGVSAWLRMVKFALVGAWRRKANFFTLLYQSWYGIVYYLRHCRK